MDSYKCAEYIAYILDQPEILCQLAEELTEAAQAALKLARAMKGTNPTPLTVQQAKTMLNEELADVNACCACVTGLDFERMDMLSWKKLNRWATRIAKNIAQNVAKGIDKDS